MSRIDSPHPLVILVLSAVLALFLSACPPNSGTLVVPDDDDVSDDDTGDDDTGDDDTTEPDGVQVSDLSWRLHDEVESLVYVEWTQSAAAAVHVEYGFDEGEWLSSPSREADAGTHEQLLVGIPFGTDASWQVVIEEGGGAEGETLTTGDAPDGLPLATVEVASSDQWLPGGNYLLASINQNEGGWTGGHYWTFIVDRAGRPVWAHVPANSNWTLFAQVSVSGDHILWDEATYWSSYDDGAGSSVHRTYLDAEIEEIATPGLHHAFVELPDGTLVWGSQDHGGSEALVEKGPDDTDETVLWTCQDDWPGSVGMWGCESNGLFYVEQSDSFLYSFYTNNSVVEVDRGTGQSLWWAGEVGGGYDFVPSDSQFYWQHGISYTDSGSLLVSTAAQGWGTRLREYEVDHDAEILDELWSFNPGIDCETNGDAWRLANGNTLHLVGDASQVYEVDAAGQIVWRLDFHGTRLLGRGEFIEDLYALVSPG